MSYKKLLRAAYWLVFTGQYGKAVELLMRSEGMSFILILGLYVCQISYLSSADETHQMMSGTVVAPAPFIPSSKASRSLDLREHYD